MTGDEFRQQVSKTSVDYRPGSAEKRCGNCVMFHPSNRTCDLVEGQISPGAVCDKWQAKP